MKETEIHRGRSRRSWLACLSCVSLMIGGASLFAGCKEEPIFVIKFEPQDLSLGGAARGAATGDGGGAGVIAKPKRRGADPALGCEKDGDCVRVSADCCGCTGGGKAAVMTRTAAKVYEASAPDRCGEAVCMQMMSKDPSCQQVPACREGRCVLVEAAAGAKTAADGGVLPAVKVPARSGQPATR